MKSFNLFHHLYQAEILCKQGFFLCFPSLLPFVNIILAEILCRQGFIFMFSFYVSFCQYYLK